MEPVWPWAFAVGSRLIEVASRITPQPRRGEPLPCGSRTIASSVDTRRSACAREFEVAVLTVSRIQ